MPIYVDNVLCKKKSDSSIFRDIQILIFFAPRVFDTNSEISFLYISTYTYWNYAKFYIWGSLMMLFHIKKKWKNNFFQNLWKNFDSAEPTNEKNKLSQIFFKWHHFNSAHRDKSNGAKWRLYDQYSESYEQKCEKVSKPKH